MGNTLDKIDDGFYICGVGALHDIENLKKNGIKCILNVAKETVHQCSLKGPVGGYLDDHLAKNFKIKTIGADDSDKQDLSVYFEEMSDFIEVGREMGGVVVHCAAGISRACTACMAYLILRKHYTVQTSFRIVHSVRGQVHPNTGFWRQLMDLESMLVAQGVSLRQDPRPFQVKELSGEYQEILQQWNRDAAKYKGFTSVYITARITCLIVEQGQSETVIQMLRSSVPPHGIHWQQIVALEQEENVNEGKYCIGVRAGMIGTRKRTAKEDLISAINLALGENHGHRVEIEKLEL